MHFNFLYLGQRTGEVQLIFSLSFSFPFLLKNHSSNYASTGDWKVLFPLPTAGLCAHLLLQGMQVLQPQPRLTAGLQQGQAGAERAFCFVGAEIF